MNICDSDWAKVVAQHAWIVLAVPKKHSGSTNKVVAI